MNLNYGFSGHTFATNHGNVTVQAVRGKRASGYDLHMITADGSNKTQSIDKFDSDKLIILSCVNSNYFQMSNGRHLGVESDGTVRGYSQEPKQKAWLTVYQKNGALQMPVTANDYWYAQDQVDFACSPYCTRIINGIQNVQYSTACNNKDGILNEQTAILKFKNGDWAHAIFSKCYPVDCENWAWQFDDIDFLMLMDSGGSTQMYECTTGKMRIVRNTGRWVSDALVIAKIKGEEDKNDQKEEGAVKMNMNGIDISNWQAGLDLSKVPCDFVIVKATEGKNFVDKYCDKFYQQAKKLGKKLGFYHFARPEANTAKDEADFFYQNTKNYFHEAIPVLDWESSGKSNVAWALDWLNTVYKLSGVKPLIYMSESVVNTYYWQAVADAGYELWVAKYRDGIEDWNYDMSLAGTAPKVKWWSKYVMWQWTSSGRFNGYSGKLDCDIFYGSALTWDKLAGVTSSDTAEQPSQGDKGAQKTIDELAAEVIRGDWGTGWNRQNALTQAGYDYEAVQKRVNEILSEKNTLHVGDTVKVKKPYNYKGKHIKLYYPEYTVMEINGDRVVIGVNGKITCAVKKSNLQKV